MSTASPHSSPRHEGQPGSDPPSSSSSTDVEPWILQTQQTLGNFITKPKLIDKYLRKPPFRFLHDIVTETFNVAGVDPARVFPKEHLNPASVSDKGRKVAFLEILLTFVVNVSGQSIDVTPAKIAAGLEADKTNLLLQMLHECVTEHQSKIESTLGAADPTPDSASLPVASEPITTKAAVPVAEEPLSPAHKSIGEQQTKVADDSTPTLNRPTILAAPDPKHMTPVDKLHTSQVKADDLERKEVVNSVTQIHLQQQQTEVEEDEELISTQNRSPRRHGDGRPPSPTQDRTKDTDRPRQEETRNPSKGQQKQPVGLQHQEPSYPAELSFSSLGNVGDVEREDHHGKLVKDILNVREAMTTQRDSTGPDKRGTLASEREESNKMRGIKLGKLKRQNKKDEYTVDHLRSALQTLCQAVNPLGKSMEFVETDLTSMNKELRLWRAQYRQASEMLRSEQLRTSELILPIQQEVESAEAQLISEQQQVTVLKCKVLENDERIQNALLAIAASERPVPLQML
eukprot:GHVQ01013118.1.p1 GENE.GHVQ01013118.1~~GHVQ01013118.1.p1  ORF type:complete len:515 (+),score=83.23 GHVQ01013118.1:153-1697(+)